MSKERPIIFSSEMVKAILEGRKTQTRRVVKPQPVSGVRFSPFVPGQVEDGHGRELRCPYAVERLWLRESWGYWGSIHTPEWVIYRADGDKAGVLWKSPMFMPRWASRIALDVVSVRMERLQEIRSSQIVAEGVREDDRYLGSANRLRHPFIALWDSINAKRGYGWDKNPWVWAIEFERVAG